MGGNLTGSVSPLKSYWFPWQPMERKPNSEWNGGSLKYPISLPFFSCLLFPKLSLHQGIIFLLVLMPFMGRESNKRGKAAGDPTPTLPVLTQWSSPVGWCCNEIIILKFESAVTQIMKHLEKNAWRLLCMFALGDMGQLVKYCSWCCLYVFSGDVYGGGGAGKWARSVPRQTNSGRFTTHTQEDMWRTLTWKDACTYVIFVPITHTHV